MKYNNSDYVEVKTGCDEFENALRKFGVVAACEWFGHASDSDFTKETVKYLNDILQEDKDRKDKIAKLEYELENK